MPVVNMATLFCIPSDIDDYMGSEGAGSRVNDDTTQASGQTITARATAAAGATSVSVQAVQRPMQAGDMLSFYGAAMPNIVIASLTSPAAEGDTSIAVLALGSAINDGATALDQGVNTAEYWRKTKACQYATSRVKLYCGPKYTDEQLANNANANGTVNYWATIVACRWLSKRRSLVAPVGLEDDYQESMEELKAVRTEDLIIEDIPMRTAAWPSFANVSIDQSHTFHKLRVEQSISENSPTALVRYISWPDSYVGGYEN